MEPARSNVINMGGAVLTPAMLQFAWGFGHALGKKVKLVNMSTPRFAKQDMEFIDREEEWFGTWFSGMGKLA